MQKSGVFCVLEVKQQFKDQIIVRYLGGQINVGFLGHVFGEKFPFDALAVGGDTGIGQGLFYGAYDKGLLVVQESQLFHAEQGDQIVFRDAVNLLFSQELTAQLCVV